MTAPLMMAMSEGKEVVLLPQMAKRHGLFTGRAAGRRMVWFRQRRKAWIL